MSEQINNQKAKEDSRKKRIHSASVVVIIIVVVGFIYSTLTTNADDKYESKNDKVIFIEAKCLIGSLFNKDALILSNDNIEIVSQSFFNKKKTVYSYSTLKEITFSKAFNGYEAVIEYPGSFFGTNKITLYFNRKDTFDVLKNVFKYYSKNRCVITESL